MISHSNVFDSGFGSCKTCKTDLDHSVTIYVSSLILLANRHNSVHLVGSNFNHTIKYHILRKLF